MTVGTTFSLVQRYSWLAHCAGAELLAAADHAIAADDAARHMLRQAGARLAMDVQTRLDGNALRIKSVLWSVQVAGDGPLGLAARTARVARDGVTWFDLGEDPALPLSDVPDGARMLRYIPGRRATLRIGEGPDGYILKLKKPQRRDDAVLRHRATLMAAQGSGITLPDLRGNHGDHGFGQGLCPGTALDAGPCSNGSLRQVGQVIARLHGQDARDLPTEPETLDAAAWLAAALPNLTPPKTGDVPPIQKQALCHGDLALGQFLEGPQGLCLVDLDRCHRGDAADDLARLLVSLQDEPGLQDWRSAAEAICQGYLDHAALPMGLAPALAKAEVNRLQLLLSKGLASKRRIIAGLGQAGVAWQG